jgi:hypothetical protein
LDWEITICERSSVEREKLTLVCSNVVSYTVNVSELVIRRDLEWVHEW